MTRLVNAFSPALAAAAYILQPRNWITSIFFFALFYSVSVPTLRFKYKLTIEVLTPYGTRRNSSVIYTKLTDYRQSNWGFVESRMLNGDVDGEAIIIKIDDTAILVALLTRGPHGGDDGDFIRIVPDALGGRYATLGELRSGIDNAKAEKKLLDVPREAWPTLLFLGNRNDPQTARLITPENIEQVVGPGYKIIGFTLEFTNDFVTHTIYNDLPWLREFKGPLTGSAQDPLSTRPSGGTSRFNFIKESSSLW